MSSLGFGFTLLNRIEGEIVEPRTGRRLGGQNLRSTIGAGAQMFRQLAASPAQRPILMALDLTLESVVAYLGALVSGLTVVPIDAKEWQFKGSELVELLKPSVIWFPSGLKPPVLPASLPVTVRGLGDVIDNAAGTCRPPFGPLSDGDSACFAQARIILMTSGSTGRPALVRVSDTNLLANTRDIVASQSLSARDKALLCLPLNYCFGASVLHSHLWAGGSVVVDDRLMFPEKVLDTMTAEGCTTFAGVPTSFIFLHTRSTVLQRKFKSLRLWLQAGGYLAASVVKAFRTAHPETSFTVMYGQTEATARIASFVVDGDYPHGCVGYPMASLEIEIRSEDGAIKSIGEEGDVWIRGASVCTGYFSNPEREADKFVGGWLCTGDIGYLLQDGRLCITGRADSFIKVRGRRVSSMEVEDVVWRTLAVRSCACALPDQASGEVIGICIESSTRGMESFNDQEWSDRLRRVLPQHWDLGPVICTSLPMTSSGKINRRDCLALLMKARERLCL